MSANLEDKFSPSAWHEGGVVRAPARSAVPRKKRRVRGATLAATSFALLTACVTPSVMTIDSISVVHGWPISLTSESPPVADQIDPSEWGRLVRLVSVLPRDHRRDPDDPEPFI